MDKIESHQTYVEQQFERVNLAGAELRESVFEACEFNDCDFSASTLARCQFVDCRFNKCNLSLMAMGLSRFASVAFIECKLMGLDWTRAQWPSFDLDPGLVFRRCILNDSSFFGLTLNELHLDDCKVHDVDFREGDFSKSIMRDCEFTGSLFMRTNLSKVDFAGSEDFSIDVSANTLTQAKFSRIAALSLLDSLGVELVD